jgi:UDP-2,3-diacylglucosamine pyrophosphatase LpxH
MPQDDGHDIVIVSDFHMSAGYNRRTGTYDRNEDFFYDAAFSRFVDSLLSRAESEGRRWRLVILGDLFDFLQVNAPKQATGQTTRETTLAQLDIIARGHAEVFAALARFTAAGHLLDLVIGNHDIELIWPEVQQRFRTLTAQRAPSADPAEISARIAFHPWLFYVPGLVYAEHGQQHDALNSFTTLLQPFMPDDESVIELPLGSFFVLYLFNRIERLDPFADNIRPVTRYLAWAFRTHPVVALSTLGYHVRFFVQVLRKTSNLSAAEQTARRKRYREQALRPNAAQLDLSPEIVEALDDLAAIPALSSRWRQLEALLLRPALPALPTVAAMIALYQGVKRVRPGLRSFVSLMMGLGVLTWRERRLLRPVAQGGSYMFIAAQRVHACLLQFGIETPAYVFGHTHIAEQAPLTENDEAPRYFNTGTWTPLLPQTFDLLGTRERFSFVQITRDRSNGQVMAALLVWNDAAGRAEPLPLLT